MARVTKLKRRGTERHRAASSCNAFAIVTFSSNLKINIVTEKLQNRTVDERAGQRRKRIGHIHSPTKGFYIEPFKVQSSGIYRNRALQLQLESVQLRRHCNSKATPTSRQSIWHIISIFCFFLFENIAFWEVPPGNHKRRLAYLMLTRGVAPRPLSTINK